MLMCASKMLRHVNLQHYSESIRTAIREVLAAGKVRDIIIFIFYKSTISLVFKVINLLEHSVYLVVLDQ